MKVLVLGGTRYFGVHMVQALIQNGHDVTIATRGRAKDAFGDSVNRITVERTSKASMAKVFGRKEFDVVCDNLAYCSDDVRAALDTIRCKRYVMTSSASVYDLKRNTLERDFDPLQKPLEWCDRAAYPYDEIKRFAECALFQAYKRQNAVAVRFPFVIGRDDYTKRLYFYVEHVVRGIPMYVDNQSAQMSFVSADEAGKFLAFLAENHFIGTVNGSNEGTISINEMIQYVETQTGKRAVFSENGEAGPYNGTEDYSINTQLAAHLGFHFLPLSFWLYDLLDTYIALAKK